MSVHRALPLALATLAGVAIGWVVKPDGTHADGAENTNEPVLKRETRRAGNDDSRIAARWIDRMGTGDVEKVAKEIPTNEIKAVMDGLMEGIWGSLSNEQMTRMQFLIGEWAEKDPEGVLAWARNLHHPQQRELGLSCIASAVGQKDPQAAFEIYAELEKVTMHGPTGRMYGVVSSAYESAAKKGPEALLDLIRRTPESDGFSMGLPMKYPPDFDFETMLEGMAGAGYFKTTDRTSKPFDVESPLAHWAMRDRDAAFDYLVDHAKPGSFYKILDVTNKMAETQGKTATQEWIGAKLAALDSSERQELAQATLARHSGSSLQFFIEAMPTPEAAAEFRYEILQATTNEGFSHNFDILNEVPDLEQRLATIGRLHGMTNTDGLIGQLKVWNVPQERIDTIVEKVKRKED